MVLCTQHAYRLLKLRLSPICTRFSSDIQAKHFLLPSRTYLNQLILDQFDAKILCIVTEFESGERAAAAAHSGRAVS